MLVPAIASWHEHHEPSCRAVASCSAVPGHVLLETFSVLTRLPAPHRMDGRVVIDALGGLDLPVLTLTPATAVQHGQVLCTRARRALPTYDAVAVALDLLGD